MRVCPPLVSEREVARLRIRLRSSLKRTRVSRRRSCANQSSAFARTVFGTFGKQFAKRQLPLAERRTRVSVAPMRPAITAFNPSRCVVTCKALPAPHPVKQHKFLRHQPKNSRPQIQRCCATPEDKQSTEEDEVGPSLLQHHRHIRKPTASASNNELEYTNDFHCRTLRVYFLRKIGL